MVSPDECSIPALLIVDLVIIFWMVNFIVSALSRAGAPAISLVQNGWNYFDLHHTPDDTLDKIDRSDVAQNTAVYAAYTWMVANIEGGFHPPEK